jgi:hypothetical protein
MDCGEREYRNQKGAESSRRARGAMPHAAARSASVPPAVDYRRREPRKTALHTVVREHLDAFLANTHRRDGEGYPRFIEHEFRRYLDWRLLEHEFARLRCPSCGDERLVAFSCKGRLGPSCTGRRMADIAAHLVDHLLPVAAAPGAAARDRGRPNGHGPLADSPVASLSSPIRRWCGASCVTWVWWRGRRRPGSIICERNPSPCRNRFATRPGRMRFALPMDPG